MSNTPVAHTPSQLLAAFGVRRRTSRTPSAFSTTPATPTPQSTNNHETDSIIPSGEGPQLDPRLSGNELGSGSTQGMSTADSDDDSMTATPTGTVRPREDDVFMGYMRPRDAGQVLRANALDKAKKSGLTSEQVTDVLAFCDLSPVGMLVDLKIHYSRTENDLLRRFLHMFVRHPDFMIRLRHVVAAALLAPSIPAYVEGTSAQVTNYIEDNVEKLLGVSSSCRRDPADWTLVKTAIVAELTNMRATIKEKLELSIKKELDIYDLTASLMMYGMRPKDEHWGRFAFLRQLTVSYQEQPRKGKKGEYWQFIDQAIRKVREAAYAQHPTNATARQLYDTSVFADALGTDIEAFPITSGAIAQAVYTNDKIPELQLETERAVGRFFVNDRNGRASQSGGDGSGSGGGADGGAEAGGGGGGGNGDT